MFLCQNDVQTLISKKAHLNVARGRGTDENEDLEKGIGMVRERNLVS